MTENSMPVWGKSEPIIHKSYRFPEEICAPSTVITQAEKRGENKPQFRNFKTGKLIRIDEARQVGIFISHKIKGSGVSGDKKYEFEAPLVTELASV